MISQIQEQYKKELELLEQHGYRLTEEGFSSDDGSFIEHNFSSQCYLTLISLFITDKYAELNESDNLAPTLDKEEVLSYYGYNIVCESPFEIKDPKGKLITCEFANFFYQELKNKYIEDTTIV